MTRFLADAMLHGLARWLRVLDYDTLVCPEQDDPALVAIADRQARVLLTRDRPLIEQHQPRRVVLIKSDKPLNQLSEVVHACALSPPARLFTRCTRCNTPVRALTEQEARSRVPPDVRQRSGPFRRCPDCGRVYWPGSHTERMRQALASALPE